MTRAFERVYSMSDFYDGPRGGLADFDGQPHHYWSRFDDKDDEYEDVFELRPVDAETLALALEDEAIWMRWLAAHRAGLVAQDTHPTLPEDRARHDEITTQLDERLRRDRSGPVTLVRAEFRTVGGASFHASGENPIEVLWTPLP